MYQFQQRQFQPQIETDMSSGSSTSQSGASNIERMHQFGMRRFVFPSDLMLQRGSHGFWVTMLQRALLSKDLQCTVDGSFGLETEVVLRNFQRLNRLDVDGVAGGDTLRKLAVVAPTSQTESSSQQASAASQSDTGQQEEAQNTSTEIEHHVFPGESLWQLAQQYYGDGNRWREIAEFNGLSNASVLRVGQVIRIPNATASTGTVVSETPASQSASGSANADSQSGGSSTPSANGRVDSGGMAAPDPISLAGLSGLRRSMAEIYNDKGSYLRQKATQLSITASAAAAVLHVESGGRGFSSSTGDMIIRFENHIFWDQWGKANPEQFRDHFSFSSNKRWTEHRFRATPNDPWESFHGNQALEWKVLNFARDLSDTDALNSISMGAAQIMGFNSKSIGYNSVQEMFEAMTTSLPAQLDGMFSFIERNSRCMRGLQNNDFVTFASGYNGSGQAETYGGLISAAESAYREVTAGRTQA